MTIEHSHMPSIIFDTLAYAKKLKAAGVPEAQAEVQAEAMAEIIEEKLCTKKDLKDLEIKLTRQIKNVIYKLTIRLGGMLIAGISALGIINKLL